MKNILYKFNWKLTIISFCSENIEYLKFRKNLKEGNFHEVYSDELKLENSYIIDPNI